MNKVILVGRIGKDPEEFTPESGNVISKFSVATSDDYKDKSGEWVKQTDWHNCVLFKRTKLKKGDLVTIEGKMKTRSFEDKEGVKKYVTEVVVLSGRLAHRNKPENGHSAEIPATPPENSEHAEDDLPF